MNLKKEITILWLDDIREPKSYLTKERGSNAWVRNNDFYKNILSNYNTNFVWVKNLKEFQNYIINNPMPDLISFDHDLRPKGYIGEFENGIDCLKWLIRYCKEKSLKLPTCYAHTANNKQRPLFNDMFNTNDIKISLSESDIKKMVMLTIKQILNEAVYADKNKLNQKKKTIGLTYNSNTRNIQGSALKQDNLKTDKMDTNNGDTYEVPLKGGIMSYNITDINGVQIMHYFKKTWAKKNEKVNVDIDDNGVKSKYQLTMDRTDEDRFINKFKEKVGYVVNDWINKHGLNKQELTGISIYPVPSSSNFNNKFVKEVLKYMNIAGLGVQVINDSLLKKDLSNLTKDEEFIEKNKEFYDGNFSDSAPELGTVKQRLNTRINRYQALNSLKDKIDKINVLADQIISANNQNKQKSYGQRGIASLVERYKEYYDLVQECLAIKYFSDVENEKKGINNSITPIKYSKGPSIETRKNEIWAIVKPFLRGKISNVTNNRYGAIDICYWSLKGFEIKKLANSVRLGLKNYYSPNYSGEAKNGDIFDFQAELDKIKNTVFLIFDDNISGGATLSDICYQCKQIGIENIIPITFGKMRQSNSMGVIKLNTPQNDYNFN